MESRININNYNILSIREQYNTIDNWLKERLESVLPEIMKREAIDMWVVMAREYNEDPLFLFNRKVLF